MFLIYTFTVVRSLFERLEKHLTRCAYLMQHHFWLLHTNLSYYFNECNYCLHCTLISYHTNYKTS